jgi:predicted HTH domain antitoxin
MTITVPDETISGLDIAEDDLRRELAIALFQQEKLTLAQASQMAGVNRIQFQHTLAARGIPVHFTPDDWQDELQSLDRLRSR